MKKERNPRTCDSAKVSGAEYKASFRVLGTELDLGGLSSIIKLTPTRTHKAGEPNILGEKFDRDMWLIESPLGRDVEFAEHIRWINNAIGSHISFLKSDKKDVDLSLVLNYRVYDTDQGGFTLSTDALRACAELGVRMEFFLLFI